VSKSQFPSPECGEPNIEIELIHRPRRPKPSVLYGGVPPDAQSRGLQPHQRRLIRRDRLAKNHVLGSELCIVVELTVEVKPLVALPIAVAQDPLKDPHALGRLGRIGPKPLDEGILT
jgi:hypothetical protein